MPGEGGGEKIKASPPAFSLSVVLCSWDDPVGSFKEVMALARKALAYLICTQPSLKIQQCLHVEKPLFFLLHLPCGSGDQTQGITS